MIIAICQGQPELALRIVQPGCDGGQMFCHEDIRLVISPPACPVALVSPVYMTGCWVYPPVPDCPPPPLDQRPVVVYPAFEINEHGEVVFRFDDLLYRNPPGRYLGRVEFNNGCVIQEIDIDLCNTPFLIDRARVTPANTCGA